MQTAPVFNATTFPPQRNLKVGKPHVATTPSAVNETSSPRDSHFQFSAACNTPSTFPHLPAVYRRHSPSFYRCRFSDTNTDFSDKQASDSIFFYRCHARYQLLYRQYIPSSTSLDLFVALMHRRRCWFNVVRASMSI